MKRVENLECGLKIQKVKKYDCIQVYGDTYKFRSLLRELNGEWNGDTKRWEFPLDDETDRMLNKLRTLPPNWTCCSDAVVRDMKHKIFTCEKHGNFPRWFCHHENAKILNSERMYSQCRTCSPCPYTGGFLICGRTYTSN